MAQEIKRKHQLGTTIQDSNFGQGHSWLFEGEGDPSTGTSLEIQQLNDINAPIGSKFFDLVSGDTHVKVDSTPDEQRGLYKIGVWQFAGVSLATATVVGGMTADYDDTTSTLKIDLQGNPILV